MTVRSSCWETCPKRRSNPGEKIQSCSDSSNLYCIQHYCPKLCVYMCNCILELPAAGRLWSKIAVKKFVAAFCNPIQSYWTRPDGPSKLTAVCLIDFSRSPIKMKAFKHKTYSNIESFEVPFLYYVDRKFVSKKNFSALGCAHSPSRVLLLAPAQGFVIAQEGWRSPFPPARCKGLPAPGNMPFPATDFLHGKREQVKQCLYCGFLWSERSEIRVDCWLLMGLFALFKYPPNKVGAKSPLVFVVVVVFVLFVLEHLFLPPVAPVWTRSSQAGNTQLTHASRKAKRRSAQPPASLQAVVFSHGSLTAWTKLHFSG